MRVTNIICDYCNKPIPNSAVIVVKKGQYDLGNDFCSKVCVRDFFELQIREQSGREK